MDYNWQTGLLLFNHIHQLWLNFKKSSGFYWGLQKFRTADRSERTPSINELQQPLAGCLTCTDTTIWPSRELISDDFHQIFKCQRLTSETTDANLLYLIFVLLLCEESTLTQSLCSYEASYIIQKRNGESLRFAFKEISNDWCCAMHLITVQFIEVVPPSR